MLCGQNNYVAEQTVGNKMPVTPEKEWKPTVEKLFGYKLGARAPQIVYRGVDLKGRVLVAKPRTQVKLFMCSGAVEVKGKCKSIELAGCYDVELKYEKAAETVALRKCENVTVTGNAKSFSVEEGKGCKIEVVKAKENVTVVCKEAGTGAKASVAGVTAFLTATGEATLTYDVKSGEWQQA